MPLRSFAPGSVAGRFQSRPGRPTPPTSANCVALLSARAGGNACRDVARNVCVTSARRVPPPTRTQASPCPVAGGIWKRCITNSARQRWNASTSRKARCSPSKLSSDVLEAFERSRRHNEAVYRCLGWPLPDHPLEGVAWPPVPRDEATAGRERWLRHSVH